jgi:catechol 2,3-dioxygenase-like lactoylglutathione lyase family enzyme
MHWTEQPESGNLCSVLSDCDVMAFVSTTDLKRARGFYVETLGLPMVADTPIALVLDAHGTTLRVSVVDVLPAAPFTVLGWITTDITAEVSDLAERGVSFQRFDGMEQDALGIWTTPVLDKVAWFCDPDANVLSLTQMATAP